MNLAKSIKDLTNNLREITKQKVDLEKMVQVEYSLPTLTDLISSFLE